MTCRTALSEGANFCRKCGAEQLGGRERLLSELRPAPTSQLVLSMPSLTSPPVQNAREPVYAPPVQQPINQIPMAIPLSSLRTQPLPPSTCHGSYMPPYPSAPELPQMQRPEAALASVSTLRTQPLFGTQEATSESAPMPGAQASSNATASMRTQPVFAAQEVRCQEPTSVSTQPVFARCQEPTSVSMRMQPLMGASEPSTASPRTYAVGTSPLG